MEDEQEGEKDTNITTRKIAIHMFWYCYVVNTTVKFV
jgi:hypothetical protein